MPREEKTESEQEESCPYLGTKVDRDIAFTFPTTAHYCYKVKKAGSINIAHQSAFCLSRSYVGCDVYKDKRNPTVPINIQGTQPSTASKIRWSLILVFAAGLTGLVLASNFLISDQNSVSQPAAQSEIPATASNTALNIELTVTQIAFEIDQIIPSETVTPAAIEETPALILTAVGTAGPGLVTPFGPEGSLLLHEISPGESLGLLAELYGTSIELLREINAYDEELPVQAGEIWVVMPGRISNLNLSKYAVYKVQTGDTVASLADKFQIAEVELRLLNSLGDGDELDSSRWIIYEVEQVDDDG